MYICAKVHALNHLFIGVEDEQMNCNIIDFKNSILKTIYQIYLKTYIVTVGHSKKQITTFVFRRDRNDNRNHNWFYIDNA